jgi:hypothetical protein
LKEPNNLIELLTEAQDNEEDDWEEQTKPPAKEDEFLRYPFLGGEAIEKAAQGYSFMRRGNVTHLSFFNFRNKNVTQGMYQ